VRVRRKSLIANECHPQAPEPAKEKYSNRKYRLTITDKFFIPIRKKLLPKNRMIIPVRSITSDLESIQMPLQISFITELARAKRTRNKLLT